MMFMEEIEKDTFDAELTNARKMYESDPLYDITNRKLVKKIKKLSGKNTKNSKNELEEVISDLYNEIFGYHGKMERIFYRSNFSSKEKLKDISKKLPEAVFVHVRVSAEDDEDEDAGEAWIVALMPDPMAAYEFRKHYADCSLLGLH